MNNFEPDFFEGAGAKERALKAQKDGFILVSYKYYEPKVEREIFKYSVSFPTVTSYLHYIDTLPKKERLGFHTNTLASEETRLKTDIDIRLGIENQSRIDNFESELDLFISKVIKFFKLDSSVKCHISERCREDKDLYKISYHLVFDAYFPNYLCQKQGWKEFVDENPNFEEFVDFAVYSKDGAWNETKRNIQSKGTRPIDLIPSYINKKRMNKLNNFEPFSKKKSGSIQSSKKKILKSKLKKKPMATKSQYSMIKKILNELDSKYYSKDIGSRTYWRNIAWALCSYDNTEEMFKLFLNFSKKVSSFNDDDEKACKQIWDNYKEVKNGITIGTLITYHKNSQNRDKDIKYRVLFKPERVNLMEDIEDLGIETSNFEVEYLTTKPKDKNDKNISLTFIDDLSKLEGKIDLIKSKTGSGKTTMISHICSEYKKKGYEVLSLVSRQSMAYNHNDKLDLKNYLNRKKGENLGLDYVICLNSIEKCIIEEDHPPFILIIDEYSSFIKYLQNEIEDYQARRIPILKTFLRFLEKASFVIGADSDLSTYTIDFIKTITKKPIHLYSNQKQYINQCPAEIFDSEALLMEQVKDRIMNGKPIFVGSDSVKNITKFYEKLEDEIHEFDKKHLTNHYKRLHLYTRFEGDKNDFIFPESWCRSYIFCSPTISYGLDCNYEAEVFGFYYGNSIDASEATQQLARVRKPTKINIYIKNKTRTRKFYSKNALEQFYDMRFRDTLEMAYNELKVNIEFYKDILMDLYFHIPDILKQKGHTVIYNSEKPEEKVEKIKTKKMKIKLCDDPQFKLFMSYHKFSIEEFRKELKKKKDYTIELERTEVNKMILIKRLCSSLSVDNPFEIDLESEVKTNPMELKEKVSIDYQDEIKRAFRLKVNISDVREGKRLVLTMLGQVWSQLVKTKRKKVGGKDFRFKYVDSELVESWKIGGEN